MSRHLWNASRAKPDESPRHPSEPHLGIFSATIRAVKGLTGRPAAESRPGEVDLPGPRPAPEGIEPPPSDEETTQELPRYTDREPTEPALSMLSPGRHGRAR